MHLRAARARWGVSAVAAITARKLAWAKFLITCVTGPACPSRFRVACLPAMFPLLQAFRQLVIAIGIGGFKCYPLIRQRPRPHPSWRRSSLTRAAAEIFAEGHEGFGHAADAPQRPGHGPGRAAALASLARSPTSSASAPWRTRNRVSLRLRHARRPALYACYRGFLLTTGAMQEPPHVISPWLMGVAADNALDQSVAPRVGAEPATWPPTAATALPRFRIQLFTERDNHTADLKRVLWALGFVQPGLAPGELRTSSLEHRLFDLRVTYGRSATGCGCASTKPRGATLADCQAAVAQVVLNRTAPPSEAVPVTHHPPELVAWPTQFSWCEFASGACRRRSPSPKVATRRYVRVCRGATAHARPGSNNPFGIKPPPSGPAVRDLGRLHPRGRSLCGKSVYIGRARLPQVRFTSDEAVDKLRRAAGAREPRLRQGPLLRARAGPLRRRPDRPPTPPTRDYAREAARALWMRTAAACTRCSTCADTATGLTTPSSDGSPL